MSFSAHLIFYFFFFFTAPATSEIYTLSLHDALPIFDLLALGAAQKGARVVTGLGEIERLLEHLEPGDDGRSEEHTSELQSRLHLVCRLLLEKKKKKKQTHATVDKINQICRSTAEQHT